MAAIPWGGLVVTVLLVPGVLFAEPRDRGELDPAAVKVSQYASTVVFAAQAKERETAETVGLGDIELEVKRVHQALRRLEAAQKGPASTPGAVVPARVRSQAREQNVRNSLAELADKRTATASKAAKIENRKQRAMAKRALQKLEELEQETEAVLDAPASERLSRLIALQKRWEVKKFGLPRAGEDSTPNFRAASKSVLRVVPHSPSRLTKLPESKITSP